jgi:Ser/Thr protein kinase RdoA (MazF antagonist)
VFEDHVRDAFGWSGDIAIYPGPRGALGQIWRLDTGSTSYALKEIFHEAPAQAVIDAELALSRRAVDAGVRLPASFADRDGRYVLPTPRGTWLRLYEWVDLRPIELEAPDVPQRLGRLLAQLHSCAPSATAEPTGEPPDPWYHQPPALDEWTDVAASNGRLADRLGTLPELCAGLTPPEPDELVLCHRDLHPANVLADPSGALVVVDWDNLGPATPSRELARAVFDWYCECPDSDLAPIRVMYEAYIAAGGPGRISGRADFSMLVASRLNFLLRQSRIAADPHAEQRHRDWAEREIDEALQILPTPRQLTEVLRSGHG